MGKFSYLLALVVGLAIGVCATMALHINRPGPDAGDWLSFAGALIGVSLTIIGTLWLEDYRAHRAEREGKRIYLATIAEIEAKLESAARARGEEAISEFRAKQISIEGELVTAIEKMIYARHYVPKRNISAWQNSEELWEELNGEKALVEREKELIQNAGDNENVLNVNLSKMYDLRERLKPFLRSAKSSV